MRRDCCSAATWSASRRTATRAFRVVGTLKNADFVMNQVFWIGLYPGIGPAILDYMLETLHGAAAGVTENAPARS